MEIRFGIWFFESGIPFEVFGMFLSNLSMVLQYFISRSLRREDIDSTGRILIAQGGY